MHRLNEKYIIFHGKDGKTAIKQILKAKPIKNKYTTTVNERFASAIINYKPLQSFSKGVINDNKKIH